jgi:hypothetical protein
MNRQMLSRFNIRTDARPGIAVIVICASLAAAVVSIGLWNGVFKAKGASGGSQSRPNNKPFPIVLTNLTRFGFEPSAMRVPAGRCLLAVRNVSGKEPVELQVKRDNNGQAETLASEKHGGRKNHWEKYMEFGVGEYLITEAGNPQWKLRLTVVPPAQQ